VRSRFSENRGQPIFKLRRKSQPIRISASTAKPIAQGLAFAQDFVMTLVHVCKMKVMKVMKGDYKSLKAELIGPAQEGFFNFLDVQV
jgi:hypothetical protein